MLVKKFESIKYVPRTVFAKQSYPVLSIKGSPQKLSQSQTHPLGQCHQTTVTNTSSKAERKLHFLDFLWSLRNMPKSIFKFRVLQNILGKEGERDKDRHRHTDTHTRWRNWYILSKLFFPIPIASRIFKLLLKPMRRVLVQKPNV